MPTPLQSSPSEPMKPLATVLPLASRKLIPSAVHPDDVAGVVQCEEHGEHVLRYVWVGGRRYSPPAACPRCKADREAREAEARTAPTSRFETIPPRFADATFSSFVPPHDAAAEVLRRCKDYARDFEEVRQRGSCLVLIGNVGTGKTHLAHAIARAVRRQGYRALYATAADIVTAIRDTWGNRGDGTRESEVLAQFAEADLLVMDEVGRQLGTRGEEVHLFQVLDKRYEAKLPTVVMSNFALPAVKEFLSEAGFDRLRGNGGQVLTFGWDSQRSTLRGQQA